MSKLKKFLEEVKILPFPAFKQSYDWNCGTTAMNMILSYYGYDVYEKEIMDIAKVTREDGTPIEGLKDVAKHFGLKYKESFNFSIDDLRGHVDNGWPTLIMIQAWHKIDNPDWDNEWDQGHYVNCLPPTMKVLTSNGYMNIENIKEGDLVLTHKGNFKPVTKIFKNNYKGSLVNISATGMISNLKVTPEHPIMTKTYSSKLTRLIEQKDVFANTTFIDAIKLHDNSIVFSKPFMTKNIDDIDDKKAFLLGCYLGDGCLMRNVNKKNIEDRHYKGVRFIIGTKEHGLINKIVKYMKESFGLDVHYYYPKNNKCVHLRFYSVEVSNYFKIYCGEPNNKIVSNDIYYLENDLLFEFVDGWFQTDGCHIKYGKNKQYDDFNICTSYENLAYSLKIILEKLSLPFSVFINSAKENVLIVKKYYNARKSFSFHIRNNSRKNHLKYYNNTLITRLKSVTTDEYYDGYVYNLEVADDNTYIAEGVVVHNCIGHDKKRIIFADPLSVNRVYLSDSALSSRWHGWNDNGKKIGHWGLVFMNKSKYSYDTFEEMG